MTRRIQAIIAAVLVALCATPALSQAPPAADIDLRMLDPTWLIGRTAQPSRSLNLASSILDPVLTARIYRNLARHLAERLRVASVAWHRAQA